MPEEIFQYRIVEIDTQFGPAYMPQRGVLRNYDAVRSQTVWRNAIPFAAPTRELCDAYIHGIKEFDMLDDGPGGRVVWNSE